MAVNLGSRHAMMDMTLSKTQTLTDARNPNRNRNRERTRNRHGNRNQKPNPPAVDAHTQIPVTLSGTGRMRERDIPPRQPSPKNQWTSTPSLVFPRPLLLLSKSLTLPPPQSPPSTRTNHPPPPNRIKIALRKIWLAVHPDKIDDSAMTEAQKQRCRDRAANVGQATEIFKDEDRKREYDRSVEVWERLYASRGEEMGGGGGGGGAGGER